MSARKKLLHPYRGMTLVGLALALQVGEERKSLEAWCFDSGSSGNMSNSCEKITVFRPCNKFVRVADGTHLPIERHGILVLEFQSGQNSVHPKLIDVAYVPSLSYHLFSGPARVKQGRTYLGDHRGITVNLKSDESLLVPLVRNLYFTYGTRLDTETEQASAVMAPGPLPTTDVDINAHHRCTVHTHHQLLLRSAEQQGVKLKKGSKLFDSKGHQRTSQQGH